MSETRAIITGTRNCEWRRASVGILLYRNHKNSRTGLRQAIHWNGTKIKSVRVDEKRRTDQTAIPHLLQEMLLTQKLLLSSTKLQTDGVSKSTELNLKIFFRLVKFRTLWKNR